MIYNMGKGGKVNDITIDGTSILDAQGVAELVSGTNVKTIRGESVFGSGDIAIGDPITITMAATDGTTKTIKVLEIE